MHPNEDAAGAPRAPAASAPTGAGVAPKRSLIVWVGKIPHDVDAASVGRALEACGRVKEWKPVLDVKTGKHKGFGFCTFEDPSGASTALRVLSEIPVEHSGQSLSLKPNKATEEYLAWHRSSDVRGADANDAATRRAVALALSRHEPSGSASAARSSRQQGGHGSRARGAEVDPERDAQDAERREAARRRDVAKRAKAYSEKCYRKEVHEWEMHESEKLQRLRREDAQVEDAEQDRRARLREDEEDDDVEYGIFSGKPYRKSRFASRRRAQRAIEEQEDRAAAQAEVQAADASAPSSDRDHGDSKAASLPMGSADAGVVQANLQAATRKRAAVPFAQDDEDEVAPKRSLVPIRYSQEELAAAPAAPVPAAGQAQAAVEAINPVALKKQLMRRVPKDRDAVHAASLDWGALDRAPPAVTDRIRGWVRKRVQQLLGSDEETFVDFIIQQVLEHAAASDVEEALRDVLDDDTEGFVTKLYQVLIYESLKVAHGLE